MARKLTKNWFNSFIEATYEHTEAPRRYLEWAAFSVVGGVLKNHVYFKDGLFTLYPNQYIILTGPPSIGKGTAINYAWSLVKDSNRPFPLVNTISDRITAPRILQRIEEGWAQPVSVAAGGQLITSLKEHTCTLFSKELEILLGASDWMLAFLCDTWDSQEYSYQTKNMGNTIIKNMCLSLIGGTVPDYIRNMEKGMDNTVAGGFSSRCLYIFEDRRSKELPFAEPISKNPKSLDLFNKLKEDLEHIGQNLRGEFIMNTDAQIAWRNFYPATSPQPEDSDAIMHFKGRMKAHIIKLAMILSAGRKDSLIIEGPDIKTAIALVDGVRKQLDRVFRGVGNSRLADAMSRTLTTIEKHQAITKKELIKALCIRHITTEDLEKSLWVLEEAGHIRVIVHGKMVLYTIPKGKIPNPGGGNP